MRRFIVQRLVAVLAVVFWMVAAGCVSTRPGKLSRIQPHSDKPQAGNVYMLRGFIGVFSSGIDALGHKINRAGVRAHVYQDDQWYLLAGRIRDQYENRPDPEPLVLIGHSYGADDVIRIARHLNEAGVQVDLLVTLDPVTPPAVPPNVRRAYNLYQSTGLWDTMPWLRGVPIYSNDPVAVVNANIRTDRPDLLYDNLNHFNIDKKPRIHDDVIHQVLQTCPPRPQWTARRIPALPPASLDQFSSTTPDRGDQVSPRVRIAEMDPAQEQSPVQASFTK